MATYGPGIDQSQHAKSVSHIIILLIIYNKCLLTFCYLYFIIEHFQCDCNLYYSSSFVFHSSLVSHFTIYLYS